MRVGSAADKRMQEQVDLFGACNAESAVEDALLLHRIPEGPWERRVQGGKRRSVRAARGGGETRAFPGAGPSAPGERTQGMRPRLRANRRQNVFTEMLGEIAVCIGRLLSDIRTPHGPQSRGSDSGARQLICVLDDRIAVLGHRLAGRSP